jgi:hypothetical protein
MHVLKTSRRYFRVAGTGLLEHRWPAVFVATGIALLLYSLCADYLRPQATSNHLMIAWFLFTIATLLMGVPRSLEQRRLIHFNLMYPQLSPPRSHWVLVVAGMTALGVLTEANTNLSGLGRLIGLGHLTQFALLVVGVLLLVWGLGGGRLPRFHLEPFTVIALTAITLVGLFVRLWKLETAVHAFIDEANFSAVVLYFYHGKVYPLLKPEIRGFPMIYAYWQFQTVSVWGHTLAGLRMPSVILGTLTIPAVYLLGKALFDRKTALIAATILAVFPPHVHFSRLALNNIADPLFGTLAFAFLAQGFRCNRRLDFALSGASLGLTQYFYEGGRLLFPPLATGWVMLGILFWRPRPRAGGLIIAACAAILVAAPVYLTLYAYDLPVAPRLNLEVRGSQQFREETKHATIYEQPYQQSLRASILAYTTQPEVAIYYYGGKHGFVVNWLLPLLFLGLALILWQADTSKFLLVLWPLATIVGTSLLRQNLPAARYVVSFPALALLMAVGLRYTVMLLWPPQFSLHLQNLLTVVIVAGIIINQTGYYFGQQLEVFNEQFRSTNAFDGQDALFRAADFPAGTRVYIISDNAIDLSLAVYIARYLNDQLIVEILSPETLSGDQLAALPTDVDKAFFIETLDTRTLDMLRVHFVLQNPQFSPYDISLEKQLVLLYAPQPGSDP